MFEVDGSLWRARARGYRVVGVVGIGAVILGACLDIWLVTVMGCAGVALCIVKYLRDQVLRHVLTRSDTDDATSSREGQDQG